MPPEPAAPAAPPEGTLTPDAGTTPGATGPAQPASEPPGQAASPAAGADGASTPPEGPSTQSTDDGNEPAPAIESFEDISWPDDETLDDDSVLALIEWAQERGLSPEAAQALIDHEYAWEKDQTAGWSETVNSWYAELENDPKWGGENFESNRNAAKSFIAKVWGDDFLQQLDRSGLGTNPQFLRGIFELMQPSTEPQELVQGGLAGSGGLNASKLFPKSYGEMPKPRDGY